ncbi:MAG: VWA domain-containing protein [Pseudomonadota bacterium]
MTLPAGIQPLAAFAPLLRANGFAVAPDQVMGFIEGVGLLGPSNITDIRRAAVAMLAIPQDRRAEFDALFDAQFLGAALPQAVPADEEEVEAHEGTGETEEIPADPSDEDPGEEATATERLGQRALEDRPEEALALLRRQATHLPRRRSYRLRAAKQGRTPDLRRTLRDAVRRDGEIMTLPVRRRRTRQRRIVLLIDVSGSMQERTEGALRLAHTLVRHAERAEVFTLGTRLTRVTPALRLQNPGRALDRASALIADIDGGTRIGEAMEAFLAIPRYAGFARGAAVVVLSDGLERGTPDALIAATRRLRRVAWRLDWLTPIPGAEPRGLTEIAPLLDTLGDGTTTEATVRHLLSMAKAA